MMPAVELREWSVAYPNGETVLKRCSLTLRSGELAVLAGLSGAGKTTLLSSVGGVIPHAVRAQTSGSILVDGQPVADLRMTDIARRVGSVLQNPDSQIFHSTVADEIAFGCENLALPPDEIERRIAHSCALFSLDLHAATKTLSDGQKQLLTIASVLAMGQKILLLDEPLANLDFAGAQQLLRTLRALCDDGYAVLLAEHRLDLVLPYADRVLALEDGAVVESGKTTPRFAGICPSGDAAADSAAPEPSEAPMLSVREANYAVRGAAILRDLCFDIRRGERIVVLGENGCGKTTLLRLLAGLVKPSGGMVATSLPVRRGSRRWFRSVGYVYQDPSYQLFMPTVRDEVRRGAVGGAGERCLADFGLEAFAAQHPQSLSEGQKRRVGIAAALATAPRLLLLDEPTVGQDDAHLERLVRTLNSLHNETGNTMITVTHDMRCAGALADRVLWMRDGRVFREGGRALAEEYFAHGTIEAL